MKDRVLYASRYFAGLLWVSLVFVGSVAKAAELKQQTLRSWDEYVQSADSQMKARVADGGTFLWVDEVPQRSSRVRAGEILVSPADPHIPHPVPAGLIHDWIGAAFFPDTKLEDVLAVVRDYDRYKDFYKPSVVESKSLAATDEDDRFSMLLVNKEVVAKTALDSEYQACYQKLNPRRWYGIAYTTRIQEVRDYGHSGEKKLPPDVGSGYIWRLYSVTRFEERDGGVYVELEAMALSRNIPLALRWVADPIVRRVSRNSMTISLRQMQEAVHSESAVAHGLSQPQAKAASDCGRFGSDR